MAKCFRFQSMKIIKKIFSDSNIFNFTAIIIYWQYRGVERCRWPAWGIWMTWALNLSGVLLGKSSDNNNNNNNNRCYSVQREGESLLTGALESHFRVTSECPLGTLRITRAAEPASLQPRNPWKGGAVWGLWDRPSITPYALEFPPPKTINPTAPTRITRFKRDLHNSHIPWVIFGSSLSLDKQNEIQHLATLSSAAISRQKPWEESQLWPRKTWVRSG